MVYIFLYFALENSCLFDRVIVVPRAINKQLFFITNISEKA